MRKERNKICSSIDNIKHVCFRGVILLKTQLRHKIDSFEPVYRNIETSLGSGAQFCFQSIILFNTTLMPIRFAEKYSTITTFLTGKLENCTIF